MYSNVEPTHVLAKYATELTDQAIPEHINSRIKLHLLDALGAAIFGTQQPWTQKIQSVISRWGGSQEATVWCSNKHLPASHAAFINSVATHAFELDDRRVASYMHPASATLPAGLAVSEQTGRVSGKSLITAIVAGYEVGLRVGMATGRGSFQRGFYPPGIGGSFAAAVTAARLKQLDIYSMIHVFNLVATQASGLYSPTMIKRFNIGRGTYNGLLAVELAEEGYSGIDNIFTAEVGGFCEAYAEDPEIPLLTAGLGMEFETEKVELKPYVSSRPNHTSIDCILSLRKNHPQITLDNLERIEIETGTANYRFGADFQIQTVEQALMSVAYCVDVAFLDGQVFLDQFTPQRLSDPLLQDLLKKTRVIHNPKFDDLGIEMRDMTVVRVRLTTGELFEAERAFAKGHPSDPLTEAEVVSKFHTLAGHVIDRDQASRIEEFMLTLENQENISALIPLLSSQG